MILVKTVATVASHEVGVGHAFDATARRVACDRINCPDKGANVRAWGARRWGTAVLGTVAVALLTGLPTVMVPNPVFTRMVPVTGWNRPVWLVTAVLAGLLVATYVGQREPVEDTDDRLDAPTRHGGAAGLLGYLAIGCPVCNKLVVLALGTSGATSWFAPVQPLLAAASIGLLAWALRARLRTAATCPVPPAD